ncbi:MAG TPA: acyl-CoA dehydrogenase family protein [Trebonia sp.]|nr:acyl-CoA dehydrogenase family protein [Trebonia sp.]
MSQPVDSAPVSERLGFADLIDRLTVEAPRRDTERLLLTDLRPELRAGKIGAIRLPRADGTRLPLTEFFEFIRELAAADSNLAHSLRNHYAGIENAILDPTPSSPRLLALAADGLLFGGAAQKQSGSSGPAAEDKVDRVGDDEYLVSGRRYYATGSLYADYLTVPVTLDDGTAQTVLIESDRPGVELPDDWDGFGQRLTGSGSIVLDAVRITSADFFTRPVTDPARPRYPFTFNQVYLTSVVAGIGNRALRDAVELVQSRTRNYYHGTAERTADEPVILAAIGVASAKEFAATATIAAAAALLERSWDAPADLDRSLAATLAASQAKITVEALVLDVIDALTQVASGSTLSTERALDRHWRNVKVLASHNPSIYKQQILGGYQVHGTRPPLDVYF